VEQSHGTAQRSAANGQPLAAIASEGNGLRARQSGSQPAHVVEGDGETSRSGVLSTTGLSTTLSPSPGPRAAGLICPQRRGRTPCPRCRCDERQGHGAIHARARKSRHQGRPGRANCRAPAGAAQSEADGKLPPCTTARFQPWQGSVMGRRRGTLPGLRPCGVAGVVIQSQRSSGHWIRVFPRLELLISIATQPSSN